MSNDSDTAILTQLQNYLHELESMSSYINVQSKCYTKANYVDSLAESDIAGIGVGLHFVPPV
jgi:hypothetical protein